MNLVFHESSNHKRTSIKKNMKLLHVKTQDQVAYIFTKSLKFEDFRKLIVCVCTFVRACVCVCVRACVYVCVFSLDQASKLRTMTSLSNIPLLCDNIVVINLSKNLILHSRAKYMEIKHYFLRDYIQKKDLR
ncbi:hypothetical protein CR513_05321, partial [Mucuna pruriens]